MHHTKATHAHTSFHELPPRLVYATMAGILVAMSMATLDQTIVATAMPKIIEDLHGFEHYAGVVTAYMVASTATMPIVGKLSDIYGRKLFLLFGVALFIFASILCGMAQSMGQLVLFRACQGIGGGALQIMAFTTIADLFPPIKRGKVTGMVGSVFGFASVVGPVIGGILTEGFGWRSVFYVNIPIGIIAFVLLLSFFPHIRSPHKEKPSIDFKGAFSLLAGIVPILLALSWGGRDYPWGSEVILGLIGIGTVFTGLFLYVETKAKEPILPLTLFRNRIVSLSLIVASIVAGCMMGVAFFLPLFVQSVLGRSALESGTILIPLTLSLVGSAMLNGQLISRTGRYKPFAIVGTITSTVGIFLLSSMDSATTQSTLTLYLVLTGLGFGASLPVFNLAVQNAVEVRVVGTATSTIQFMRAIGGSLGVAVFGSILALEYVPRFHEATPIAILEQLSEAELLRLDNPQAFFRSESAKAIEDSFQAHGPNAHEILQHLKEAARIGLTGAIHTMFLVAAWSMVVGAFLALFLKEIPLRRSNRPVPIE